MRSLPLTFCAVAIVAATLAPVPAALADSAAGADREEGGGPRASLTVTPSTVGPGGEVDLRLEGCGGRKAEGTADALVSPARFSPAADGGLFAETRIGSDTSPGDHDIRVVCEDGRGTEAVGTVTVTDRGRATPVAPVSAGGGGTSPSGAYAGGGASLAEWEARQEGPGTTHTVTGLVLAAVAAVAVALRSVRRRRPAAE
ncbi:hypothetical protein ABZZ04_12265 [Streptomyces sp. NPDC006435]|uniref:hypothetical protein n=1 Tax=Streptomyces sp. NPDC006435 TaxID=3154300 RepID=UPI0033B8ECEB